MAHMGRPVQSGDRCFPNTPALLSSIVGNAAVNRNRQPIARLRTNVSVPGCMTDANHHRNLFGSRLRSP